MDHLTICFDDMDSIILAEDINKTYFPKRVLTDVSENLPAGTVDFYYKRETILHEHDGTVPFACNFNLPIDHHRNVVSARLDKKTGTIKNKVTKVYTKNLDDKFQWKVMEEMIDKWRERLFKQGWQITKCDVYGEFTKAGMIHAHGLIYLFCSPAYAMGVSTILAKEWIRISKSSIQSVAKLNAAGKWDYAFAKCNNTKAFLAYASKGPGLHAGQCGTGIEETE